jgi:hypothetical protein
MQGHTGTFGKVERDLRLGYENRKSHVDDFRDCH